MANRLHQLRRGFTLLEMLVVITIAAVAVTVIMPLVIDDSSLRVRGMVDILRSDIELAQVMTISYPDDPIVVVFDPATERYWLASTSDTTTPITRDNGEPYLVELGVDRASPAISVNLGASGMTDNTLQFNEQGGLKHFNDSPLISLVLDGTVRHMSISPHTGTITVTSTKKGAKGAMAAK